MPRVTVASGLREMAFSFGMGPIALAARTIDRKVD
jgi:hypothetical protein